MLAGTAGYMLIGDMTFIDALYMSVITVSTVGFGEVKPLGPGGRLFTIVLIVVGVGSVVYLLTAVAELVIEGSLRDFFGRSAMNRKIHNLHEHVIVCGFGRLGRAVVEELKRHQVPMVVIESDPAREPELSASGLLYVIGSALEETVIEEAGVRTARAVVVATASDADNVYITLSAREKNPHALIHARGDSEAGLRRLRLAGADQTLSAYQWGGMRIAASILRPSVVDFLELSVPGRESEVDLEEIKVEAGSPIDGRTIAEIERANARLRVVAIKRGDEPISMIPESASRVQSGDYLVVIGEATSLKRLVGL
ncbi:MAG TPA: potassium channel protein [Candidatus Binataceae bacterium]|nr:potassium channel protein [Candidatus Binataceae bacterium]